MNKYWHNYNQMTALANAGGDFGIVKVSPSNWVSQVGYRARIVLITRLSGGQANSTNIQIY